MSESILVCDCGLRVRAPGATPGRMGRCPKCGGALRVPDWPFQEEARPKRADDSPETGYLLQPPKEASVHEPSRSRRVDDSPRHVAPLGGKNALAMADGLLPTLDRPEASWFASVLYPLRGAESLGLIAGLSAIFWIFLIVVPEYCLTLMGDADMMGTPTMGKLIALISILPVAFLLPFAILYWLQYLGRVLVASAMGETIPPRSPDRNFDGFFHGLSSWLIWLVLGGLVGLLPVLLYFLSLNKAADGNVLLGLGLVLLGLPYMLMALMMTFLHDDAMAAKPWGVMGAMFRLGGSFGLLCLFIASALALGVGAFLIALLLRADHFLVYLVLCLGCVVALVWISIVVMRILGTYYDSHKESLLWHHERPRLGVVWKL